LFRPGIRESNCGSFFCPRPRSHNAPAGMPIATDEKAMTTR
jgi:hypothetical protein